MRAFRPLLCWLYPVLAVYALAQSPAFAAVAELEFARGMVAFNQGHLQEAEGCFQRVLSEQPDNADAVYYLGQVRVGLEKLVEAIDNFRTVIRLRPSDAAARLDLALVLIKTDRLQEAIAELSKTGEQLSERAAFHYYLGYCYFRLGNFQEALTPLQKAQQLDQGFAAAAGYYLGLAQYNLGQTKQALQQFSELSHKESAAYSALARQNIATIEQGGPSRAKRRYFLYAEFGGGYDSNVTLDSNNISHARSPELFISVGGTYLPYVASKDAVELTANIYRSFYFTEATKGFSLTDFGLAAGYRRLFASRFQLEIGFMAELDCLDGTPLLGMNGFGVFMQEYVLQSRVRIFEGPFFETSAEYRFRASFFHLNRRDNFGHDIVARQDFFLAERRLKLSASAGVVVEDARGREYDLLGPLLASDITWRFLSDFSLQLAFGWQRQDHFRFSQVFGTDRVDDQLAGAFGFGWEFTSHLELKAEYQYINNRSSDRLYQYERHVGLLSVIGKL